MRLGLEVGIGTTAIVLEVVVCGAIEDLFVDIGETTAIGVKFVSFRFCKCPFR